MHRRQRILMRQHHTVQTFFRWAMLLAINVNGYFNRVIFHRCRQVRLISARFTSEQEMPTPVEVFPILPSKWEQQVQVASLVVPGIQA